MADDPFWANIFRRRTREEDILFEILRMVPIFQDLSRREFWRLQNILHRRSFAPGESIVREGEKGVGMYIIVSGRVEIVHNDAAGNGIVLATFERGDFFGEQALLDESPRTATARAVESCQAIGFFRPDLLDLIEQDPRLGLKVVMHLSQMISVRLRQTNRLLKEVQDRLKDQEAADEAAAAEQTTEPLAQAASGQPAE